MSVATPHMQISLQICTALYTVIENLCPYFAYHAKVPKNTGVNSRWANSDHWLSTAWHVQLHTFTNSQHWQPLSSVSQAAPGGGLVQIYVAKETKCSKLLNI